MYKRKNKTDLKKSNLFGHWIKRKIMLLTTAFMLGMSNAMYDEDKMINDNQNHTEQKKE